MFQAGNPSITDITIQVGDSGYHVSLTIAHNRHIKVYVSNIADLDSFMKGVINHIEYTQSVRLAETDENQEWQNDILKLTKGLHD